MTDNQLLEDIKVLNFQDKQMSLTLLNEALVAMTTDSPFYEENKKLIDEFLVKTITQYGHCENGNNLNEMLFLFWETSREEHFEIILKIINTIIDNNIAINWFGSSNKYQSYSGGQILLPPYLLLFTLSEYCLVSKLERELNLNGNKKNKLEKFLLNQKLKLSIKKCSIQFEKIYRYIVSNVANQEDLTTHLNHPFDEEKLPYLTYFLYFDCELNRRFLDYVFNFDPIQVANLSRSYNFLKTITLKSQESKYDLINFKHFTHAQYRWLENNELLEEVNIKNSHSLMPIYSSIATILSHASETMIDFYLDYQKDYLNISKEKYNQYNWLGFILSNPKLTIEFKNKKITEFYQHYQDAIYTPNLFVMAFKGIIDINCTVEAETYLDSILKLPNIDKNASYYDFGNAYFFALFSHGFADKWLDFLFRKEIAFEKNSQGFSALHKLIDTYIPNQYMLEKVFDVLKKNKIDFDEVDSNGNTTLHLFFLNHSLNEISFNYFSELLIAGSHLNIKNKLGQTAKDCFYDKMKLQKLTNYKPEYEQCYIKFESLLISSFELEKLDIILAKPLIIEEKKITKL